MSTENRPCAKCGQVQPLVLCFDCIDKRNTQLTGYKTLPALIPIADAITTTSLQPMTNGFMPLDVMAVIVQHAVVLPLEPHETAASRHTRMSLICKRARSVIKPITKPPALTASQRNRLHRIFYTLREVNEIEWSGV